MSKRYCCVVGCSNSGIKLNKWYLENCDIHKSRRATGACDCEPPFILHPFPTERKHSKSRKDWIRAIKRKNPSTGKDWKPSRDARVCSIHFAIETFSTKLNSPKFVFVLL